MAEQEHRIVSEPEQTPQRERLSQGSLGRLLAGNGNHEGKGLLSISMEGSRSYTRDELDSLLVNGQLQGSGWIPASRMAAKWCSESFVSAGLVMEVIDSQVHTLGYMKTDFGDNEGTSFAGHMLAFSERHPETSLYKLLGPTGTRSRIKSQETEEEEGTTRRPPLTRYRIHKILVNTQQALRETDIATSLVQEYPQDYKDVREAMNLIRNHLKTLGSDNILQFDTRGTKSFAFFRHNEQSPITKPSPYADEPALTNLAYDLIRENPRTEFSTDEFYNEFVHRNPQYSQLQPRAVAHRINYILNHLAKEGYATKGKFNARSQTEITLTPAQRATLTDFVTTIDRFSEGNEEFLRLGHRHAAAIASDKERYSALMEKAQSASPGANKTDPAEMKILIEEILETGTKTTPEVQQALEGKGKKLSPIRVSALLRQFAKQAGWTATIEKNVKSYSITQPPTETVIFNPQSQS